MQNLGDLERAVMEQLWAIGRPASVREVHARLTDRDLAYTTVMTVLTRLATKGYTTRTRSGRAWLYSATRSSAEMVADLMHDVLDTGNRDAVMVAFLDQASHADLDALKEALAKLETAAEDSA